MPEGAAIANANYDATVVRVRDCFIRPEKLLDRMPAGEEFLINSDYGAA